MKTSVIAAVFAAATAFGPLSIQAKAAEWGCEVLLCAAASAPSWPGIPYCVPPMRKLITEMYKPGFSWPVCTAAGTGAPGYEPYGDCPAGTVVGYTVASKRDDIEQTPNLCIVPQQGCDSNLRQQVGHGRDAYYIDCDRPTKVMSRPVRDDPYYFDLKNSAGENQRFFFNLNM